MEYYSGKTTQERKKSNVEIEMISFVINWIVKLTIPQSTVVNLVKKQKWCSLWCPWSQVQQDTSWSLFEFQVVYGQYIIDVSVVRLKRDAKCFFPTESKYCMKSASYEYRKMSARRGTQFVSIGMPTVCWKTFPAKNPTKILSTRTRASWWCHLQSTCF